MGSISWLLAATITGQQQSLGSKLHTDVVVTDVHTDVVDLQMCFGLIRSHDHNDNVHTRVPVNPKSKMAAIVKYQVFKFMFTNMHKCCWNMKHPC